MKYIRNYKTIEEYDAEKDMLVKPNISSVTEDDSIHHNEGYFECTIETISVFKIFIYFNKTDYDNREPSYVFKGLAGVNTVKFNHKIYNIEFATKVGNSLFMHNNNITKLTVKGDIIYPIALCSFNMNYNNAIFDISKLNPYSIITLEVMFFGYSRLNKTPQTIDVTELCKKTVTSLDNIFNNNYYLKHLIGLNTWDTSNCTSLRNGFRRCNILDNIEDINNWDTSKITNWSGTFKNINGPESINLDGINTKSATTIYSIFNISSYKSIYGLENWNVANCSDFSYAFCYSETNMVLNYINICNWDMRNADNMQYMLYDFAGPILDLSKWSLPKVTNLTGVLCNSCNLETLDVHNWNPINNKSLMLAFGKNGNASSVGITVKIKHIDIHGWDNNELLDMSGTFQMLGFLEDINISNFKTPKVTSINYMFNDCSSLKQLDLSSMVTSNVVTMVGAFKNCSSLIKLNICNFDNSSLNDMTDVFLGCTSLNELIIGKNYFNSPTLTKYSFKDLTNWTESSSLAILVDSLPILNGNKTLELSPATNNVLNDVQKTVIANKGWLINVV